MEKFYQGISVVENFGKWNEWFSKEKYMSIENLPEGKYYENMGIVFKGIANDFVPKTKEHGIIKGDKVFQLKKYFPCNVRPLNTEQTIAMELLCDDSISLVTMLGASGSGKTLLACAHAAHCLRKGLVSKVIITKSMTPVGRDIGYLKGSMEEKVFPWLGPFLDNFEKCDMPKFYIEKMIGEGKIEISPITFMQGRSISNSIIVVDEIQNLNMEVIKQIITRVAENCKIILLGDPTQRFERGLLDLSTFIEKGKESPLVGHIFFRKSVRSPIAEWAVKNL